jgi:hypothetical protein
MIAKLSDCQERERERKFNSDIIWVAKLSFSSIEGMGMSDLRYCYLGKFAVGHPLRVGLCCKPLKFDVFAKTHYSNVVIGWSTLD